MKGECLTFGENHFAAESGDGGTQTPLRWQFGPATLDGRERRLVVDGTEIPLDRSSCDLLLCLLRHDGATVTKEELLRAGWPGRVVTDNSLNKAIGRLRHALKDPDGALLRVVHGYGYRLVVDVQGVGPAAAAAPAAAPPPSTAADPAIIRPAPSARRRWWTTIAIGTVLMLATIGAIHVGSQSPRSAVAETPLAPPLPPPQSIAVLPFLDLSELQDQAYFSDGLADELLSSLSRLPQLRVVSRTSSFAIRGRDLDMPAIGRQLNAQHILEGSVRKSGGRLRVTVQLVKAADGYHVWSATYDRPITELFTMQDEIVRAIIGALRVELLPEQQRELARHATTSAAAYDEYLLAMSVFKDDETSNRRSLAHYQRAVQLDPEFIDAWIGMADLLGHSGLYADDAAEALAGKRRSIEIIDHVIAIAPGRADAYLTRGIHRCAHWWDWSGAEQDFRRVAALTSQDNEQYLVEYGRLEAALGRLRDAIALELRAGELNAHSGSAWTVMGYHYTALGDFAKARDALTQAVRVAPLDEHAHYYLGLGELLQSRPAQALPHFEDSAHVLRLTGLAIAHHSLGDRAASDRHLQLLITRYGHILPYQAAEVYAWRGERDKAFEWLDRAYELHDASFLYYLFDPLLESLRSDARYDALRVKLGLPLRS